ncbi:2-amino-4-hydroxy-6-hydroxymethyldihydropteridine diphosphokinase [Acetobacter okinawensis]|uniref:2-amino-4-hydroxy-6- hydroxymethyldihydropteridine diphosphokinase n=1 Tax=Acetobacter okinawensis TaxID=1076594 RepID=UPI001BAAD993|nr:2-amino-4-hydroxy-6-hydroxymethyldihydropteridine diphosphokinase [Acetobacter okinawensis]MBS0966362.1 2-amino-4-hydroxy-6-hydroxymethyldihydropteridine diphosphokinase [Acetobacter okinawensis]
MAEEQNHTRSVLIAIGANLPLGERSALKSCEQAVQALRCVPGLELEAVSRWYESAPVPPSGQPVYVNGVARGVTSLPPLALLDQLQAIETHQGRVRSVPNAARTLDLDIIDMEGVHIDTPSLSLPHPRAHERAFVLRPLHDVWPGWVHPLTHHSLEQMLRAVQGQEIRVIGE